MLQQLDNMAAVFQKFDSFRMRAASEVDKIVAELGKEGRRNIALMESACLNIDVLTREYRMFMVATNAFRVKEEANCADQGELLAKRQEWGAIQARTSLMQNEFNRWHEFRALISSQLKRKRQKLYQPVEKIPAITTHQTYASNDIFRWFHAMFNPLPQSDAARDYKCFPDIGLANSVFHEHLHAAYRVVLAQKRQRPVKFLDVGCGGGLKVYAALRYFDETQGFDFDPTYVNVAQRFLGMDRKANSSVFEQDALSYDGYDEFDVIYFYRPMTDTKLLTEMEERITETARPGTILIAPYIAFSERFEGFGCGRVDGSVYLAKTSQIDADKWRRKAELTGEYILKDNDAPLKSLWSPILEMSHTNGYDIPSKYGNPSY